MWNKSLGIIIILLKIACVSIRGHDTATDSRTHYVDWTNKKEYKLIFEKVSWYKANEFCADSGMQLAFINSPEEQQSVETLIRDKYLADQQFWVSKSVLALETASELMKAQTVPETKFSTGKFLNQCIAWYWMTAELCFGLWPLANNWSHENCSEEKYFICERNHKSETEILNVIRHEMLTLVDELMFTGFADGLSTTTASTWVSLVNSALQTWLMEQQQIATSTSNLLLDEQVNSLAVELAHKEITFGTDEVKEFVYTKFEMINDEHRVQLLNERFRQFIGDEYINLSSVTNWSKTPTDDDVNALVQKVLMLAKVQEIKLASEELAKFSEAATSGVLEEDLMKSMSQQLVEYSQNEFESYVLDVIAALENYGVEEVDLNILFQLYVLVKQEVFSLIANTVLKSTSMERIEIVNYGITRILEGKQLVEEGSVFGQIFVMLATGTAVMAEDQTVKGLDDVLLRKFVRKEFQDLRSEDMLKLEYEGYIKFVIDEFIKLAADIDSVKSDSGELLLKTVVDLIGAQLLFYAEDELKTIAKRLAEPINEETNELQANVEQMKYMLGAYDEEKLQKLMELIQRELFEITVKSLTHFGEKEMLILAAEGLSKILAEGKPIGKSSIFGKVFIAMGEELLKLTKDQFAIMDDVELVKLVKWELEKVNYERSAEFFDELSMSLLTEEFIKLLEVESVFLTAHEEEKNQFGEIVTLLASKLLDIVNNVSVYI